MSSTTPINAIGDDSQLSHVSVNDVDPGQSSAQAEFQRALQEGIAKFGMSLLQSAQSDITEAINDNTSNPDAPA